MQGAYGLAGTGGDIRNAITSRIPQVQQFLPPRIKQLPTSEQVKGAVEGQTGSLNYEPKTQLEGGLKIGGEFAPNALNEGSLLRRGAMVALPAMADWLAGKATEGSPLQPYAQTGAAILGSIAAHKATAPKEIPSTPSAAQVETAGHEGYQNPAIDAVKFKATAIPDLADNIIDTLNRDKRNARLVPDIHNIVDDMKTPVNGQVHTIEDLETTRRLLGEKAQQAIRNGDNTTKAAATIAIKKIDGYLKSNPQSDLLMGDVRAANDALSTARQNVAIGKTAGEIQQKIYAGEVGAASANSGKNVENALKQKLRPVLTTKKHGQNLTDENLQDVKDLVFGTSAGNLRRDVGHMLGGGGGIATPVVSSIAHSFGGPAAAIATPLIGRAVKQSGNAAARRQAQKIVNGILARSPEAEQWAAIQARISAANPQPSALPASLLSGLLSSPAYQAISQGILSPQGH
jgi:hypothetical protein